MAGDNDDRTWQASRQTDFYTILAAHQREQEWEGCAAVTVLQKWAKHLDDEFKLSLPGIAIRVDVLPVSQLGHFRGDHNGLGIECEVALNSVYLCSERPKWEPFATLAHQLLHAWQHVRGVHRPTYIHDAEYRRKATEMGLVITPQGMTGCIPSGPFVALLAAHGITVETDVILPIGLPQDKRAITKELLPMEGRLKGTSKLRKYSCGCTTVRVAHKNFRAQCLNCGNEFASDTTNPSRITESPDET